MSVSFCREGSIHQESYESNGCGKDDVPHLAFSMLNVPNNREVSCGGA
jgi:hypothetical protein